MTLYEHSLKNAYIGEYIYQDYTISNIPTNNSNAYLNVAKSGYTIQSVIFTINATTSSSKCGGVNISTNNSNSSRYGLTINHNNSNFTNSNHIRGRLNGATDTYYRAVSNGFNFGSTNTVVYTINRDGNCTVNNNGTIISYTAGSTELNVIQTIMNLSNMNVYGYDTGGCLVGNKVNITVVYTPNS